MTEKSKNRLSAVELDPSIGPGPSPEAEHEQGPYRLRLSTADGRLIFDVFDDAEERLSMIGLSMSPFRRIVKDYFMICESYYQAIRTATPSQID